MRINALYISAFGGIKDLRLEFNDKFNIIYGENENGKSTVMAFIKMMFYGSERGSSQLSKSVRKKYTPWDGSPMAGSIDFEHCGKDYRIEREFRLSNSTDRVTLYDLTLGERSSVPPDIGTKFLGLSAAAFERSVFIGQFGYPEGDSSAEGEINSRLSNLALTGDENISFDRVSARLEKAKTALMSKSGRAGEYDKNLKLCAQLKSRAEAAEEKLRECDAKRAELARLQEENRKISEKTEKLKIEIASEEDVRNREKLKKYLSLKEGLDSLNSELRLKDGTTADEMFLRKLRFCISKTEAAAAKVHDKQALADKLKADTELDCNPPANASAEYAVELKSDMEAALTARSAAEASELELKISLAELKEYSASKKRTVTAILLTLGILSAAAAVIFKLTDYILPFLIFAAVAALLISASVIFLFVTRKKAARVAEKQAKIDSELRELKEHISSLGREAEEKRTQLEAVNTVLNSTAAVKESRRKMLEDTQLELEELKESEEKEKKALLELLSKYTVSDGISDINAITEEIAEKAAKQREIKQQLNFIASELNYISYDEARQKLEKTESTALSDTADFASLKEEYERLTAMLAENGSKAAALAAEIKITAATAENPEELKRRLKGCFKRTADQKQFCLASDIALEALRESFAEIRKSYGSVLENTAGEFFSELTQNKYNGMTVSKAFDINVTETSVFGSRELAYLSSGAEDQAYLSLRLAISKLICSDGEALPVFLDDSLAQYDDARMKNAVASLKRHSENFQVIMFTCHNAVRCEGERHGALITAL